MMMKEEEIKEQLMSSSADFRRLVEEHHRYEAKLQEINNRRQHMSDQDHLDEITLKKKKLQLKDQMNIMVSKLREELSHQPS
jgi:uncharacterized protein YdcH (DUF465 family)